MAGPNVELSIENLGWGALMMQAMELIRQESILCDVNLMTDEGEMIPAHSLVLAAGSTFFKQLLSKAKTHNSSVIVKCSYPKVALENIVGFLYSGRITPPLQDVREIKRAAKTFGIDTLVTLCDVFANQSTDVAKGVIQNVIETNSLGPGSVLAALPIDDNTLKEIKRSLEAGDDQTTSLMQEQVAEGNNEEIVDVPMGEAADTGIFCGKIKKVYRYMCDQCNRRFTSRQRLLSHKVTHNGERAHRCLICGAAFIQIEYLREHISMHTNERPHKCHVCGKLFRIMRHLKKHMKVHSELRPYKCMDCQKTFKRSDRLKYHRRIHTGERPYVCDECGKKFKLQETMKRHQVIHTNKWPYVCDLCSAVFRRPSSLQQHKLIHTGVLPFECEKCKHRFRQRVHLRAHQNKPNGCTESPSSPASGSTSATVTETSPDPANGESSEVLMKNKENVQTGDTKTEKSQPVEGQDEYAKTLETEVTHSDHTEIVKSLDLESIQTLEATVAETLACLEKENTKTMEINQMDIEQIESKPHVSEESDCTVEKDQTLETIHESNKIPINDHASLTDPALV